MAYHDAGMRAPAWAFPGIPEANDPDWLPLYMSTRWPRVRVHVQDALENALDTTHAAILHPQDNLRAQTISVETHGPILVHRTIQQYNPGRLARFANRTFAGPMDIELLGLGVTIARATVEARTPVSYLLAAFVTPVDDEHVEINSAVSVRKLRSRAVARMIMRKASHGFRRAVSQDIPIWEDKIYRPHPPLTTDERQIMTFRRWAEQFYDRTPATTAGGKERRGWQGDADSGGGGT